MRLDCRRESDRALGRWCEFYRYGERLGMEVLEADEERGEVVLANMRGEPARFIRSDSSPHGIVTEVVRGRVEIRLKETAPEWAERAFAVRRAGEG
jgi:hypothetical protein